MFWVSAESSKGIPDLSPTRELERCVNIFSSAVRENVCLLQSMSG